MMYHGKDNELDNLTARMGLNMPNSTDVIKRSDFPAGPAGDDQYCEAAARRDLAMEKDPRLLDLKRKYAIQLEAERQKEREEAQRQRYAEIHENTKLSPHEREEIVGRANAAASADLQAGRINPKEFNKAQARYREKMEKETIDTKASNQVFNEFIREELSRNRISGKA